MLKYVIACAKCRKIAKESDTLKSFLKVNLHEINHCEDCGGKEFLLGEVTKYGKIYEI